LCLTVFWWLGRILMSRALVLGCCCASDRYVFIWLHAADFERSKYPVIQDEPFSFFIRLLKNADRSGYYFIMSYMLRHLPWLAKCADDHGGC